MHTLYLKTFLSPNYLNIYIYIYIYIYMCVCGETHITFIKFITYTIFNKYHN